MNKSSIRNIRKITLSWVSTWKQCCKQLFDSMRHAYLQIAGRQYGTDTVNSFNIKLTRLVSSVGRYTGMKVTRQYYS